MGEWTRSSRKDSYDITPQRLHDAASKGRDAIFSQNYTYHFKIKLHCARQSLQQTQSLGSAAGNEDLQINLCLIVSVLYFLDREDPLRDDGCSCLRNHQ